MGTNIEEKMPKLCKLLLDMRRDLLFSVDSNEENFEKLSITFLLNLRVFTRNLLRGNQRRNFFKYFVWLET